MQARCMCKGKLCVHVRMCVCVCVCVRGGGVVGRWEVRMGKWEGCYGIGAWPYLNVSILQIKISD